VQNLERADLNNREDDEIDFGLDRIQRVFDTQEFELFENLQMFVERIMLYRITRAPNKVTELGVLSRILLEAGTLGENPGIILQDVSWLENLAKEEMSKSEVTVMFSTMVKATEGLSARQLYYILEKLRTEPLSGPD
jgi:hypothetical protein